MKNAHTLNSMTISLHSISPKRWFVLITLACIASFGLSQKEAFASYNAEIQQAENSLCEGNWGYATSRYQQAFSHMAEGFAKDYYNASLAATLSGDTALARTWFLIQLKLGTPKSFLKKHLYAKRHFPKKQIKTIQEAAETHRITTQPAITHLIDSLYEMDQHLRKTSTPRLIYGFDTLAKKIVDSLFMAEGFPTEHVLGVDRTENLYIFLLHQGYSHTRVNILRKEALEGHFAQLDLIYAYERWYDEIIIGMLNTNDTTLSPLGIHKATYYGLQGLNKDKHVIITDGKRITYKGSPPFTKKEEARYNKHRKAIGFKTVSQRKKWLESPFIKKHGFVERFSFYH